MEGPDAFGEVLVSSVCKHYALTAASFYTYVPTAQLLRLRAVFGLDPGLYAEPQLGLKTLAGSVVGPDSPLSRYVEKVIGNPRYRDQKLATTFHLKHFVAIRLRIADPDPRVPDPVGVLCVYARSKQAAAEVQSQLESFAPFVARLFVASLERSLMTLRRETVSAIVWRNRIPDIAEAAVTILKKALRCDHVSILLYDKDSRILRLVASTRPDIIASKHTFQWPNTGRAGLTPLPLYCFRAERPIVKLKESGRWNFESMTITEGEYFREMSYETEELNQLDDQDFSGVLSATTELMMPMEEAAAPPDRITRPIGIIRASNVRTTMGSSTILDFSWEEVFQASFFAEMLAVVSGIHLRAGDYEFEFERRMHKAKSNLISAITYLNTLEDLGAFSGWPANRYYFVDNARGLISDIADQIERGELAHATIELSPIDLYPTVIALLPRYGERTARGQNKILTLNRLSETEFPKVPRVAGNETALLSVFTNLIENGVKYSRGRTVHIELTASFDAANGQIVVRVRDRGIGIPTEERALIFDDGFRGTIAKAMTTEGLGKGLADCRAIVQKLGGTLELDVEDDWTCFVVTLNQWKGSPYQERMNA